MHKGRLITAPQLSDESLYGGNMAHECPDCGQYCYCDGEDLDQPPPVPCHCPCWEDEEDEEDEDATE